MTMFQTLSRMLTQAATLKIACEVCGHQATWTSAEAVRRLGPDAIPSDIRHRLVCTACGGARRSKVWI